MADEKPKHEIISRKEAQRLGLRYYFIGKPCLRGHVSLRLTSSKQCVECTKELYKLNRDKHLKEGKRRYEENKEYYNEKAVKWRKKNPEKYKEIGRRHYRKNRDQKLAYRKEYSRTHKAEHNEYAKKWYKSNPEKAKEISRRAYEKNKEKIKERSREYRRRNLAAAKENNLKWRKENKEWVRAEKKRWFDEHPEARKAHHRNRKARKRGNGGSHTAKDVADIRRIQGDRCAMPNCRKKLHGGGHVDHIIALINGGPNDRKNLQILCADCNLSKGRKDQIDYLRSLGFLV